MVIFYYLYRFYSKLDENGLIMTFKNPVCLIKVFHTNTSLDLSRMTKQEYTTIVKFCTKC